MRPTSRFWTRKLVVIFIVLKPGLAKTNRIRRAAIGGNVNLWKAVKVAKCTIKY